jgi:hypothetical protein
MVKRSVCWNEGKKIIKYSSSDGNLGCLMEAKEIT